MRIVLLVICLALLAATARADIATVGGVVTWPATSDLPAGSTVEIALQRRGAETVTLATQRLLPLGGEARFSLSYDRRLTPAGGVFRLTATLGAGGLTVHSTDRSLSLDAARDGPITLRLAERRLRAGPGAIVGRVWRFMSARGEEIPTFARATLEVARDGSVSGSTGCNSFDGTATIGEETIAFGGILTTRRGCQPTAMIAERRVLGALSRSRAWTIKGAALSLLDERGRSVAELRSDR